MRTSITLLLGLLLSSCFALSAQRDTVLFEGLSGEALITELKANFVPRRVLTYGGARDVMFRDIYNVNDSVSCVYTGHRLYVDPGSDPSSFVFMNGGDNGINTEHTWPRSKGAASGDAFSDLHHLYPARVYVNEVRSNYPFADIEDDDTDFWYINDQELRQKPETNIDAYSEFKFGFFEPREQHKGNIARAMFHFYTFYREQADAADGNFFEKQRATLCDWHYLDPVDEVEYARTYRIAFYQDQKPNPFVLDCSLARRLYCPNAPQECSSLAVGTESLGDATILELKVVPNPNAGEGSLQFNLKEASRVSIEVVNLLGQAIEVRSQQNLLPADYQWDLQLEAPGVYILLLKVENRRGKYVYPTRFVVH